MDVFEYLCKYHVFVALGALDSLLSQNEIYVRTRYQPIPAQRQCLKGFMSTMPRTKCMKCIIKKKLSKCHAFTMDISPSLGATELFTLAEEYHYDDHSCHTCIFPPQWPTLQQNIKANRGENCMGDTCGTWHHRSFRRLHAVWMYNQAFSIFLWW